MKLYTWPTSPFGAKVWAIALAAGINDRITKVLYHPWQCDDELSRLNPLNKIPLLITDKEERLYDSPVICEYLIHTANKPQFLEPRWQVLRQQALADGMLDAAILTRYETHFRPLCLQSKDWIARQLKAVEKGLNSLNKEQLADQATLGTISIAIMLAYLDLRYPQLNWQKGRETLAEWYLSFSQNSFVQEAKSVDCPLPPQLVQLKK